MLVSILIHTLALCGQDDVATWRKVRALPRIVACSCRIIFLIQCRTAHSVLSLLIVDLADGFKYYQTFYTAATGVILLEFLHFRSQPHNPDEHALRRKKEAAMLFTNLMYVYSIALVILGTSFKMFLFEFVYESSSGDRRMLSPLLERLLAGSESAALRFDTDDRRQRIA